jgi:hypothetical protein
MQPRTLKHDSPDVRSEKQADQGRTRTNEAAAEEAL